jgi:hypothetical protein
VRLYLAGLVLQGVLSVLQVTEMAEAKWPANPFNKHFVKHLGTGYVFVRRVCVCGKKSNQHCKGVLCGACCKARGEPCKAHTRKPRKPKVAAEAKDADAKEGPKERAAGNKKGAAAARKTANVTAKAAAAQVVREP